MRMTKIEGNENYALINDQEERLRMFDENKTKFQYSFKSSNGVIK